VQTRRTSPVAPSRVAEGNESKAGIIILLIAAVAVVGGGMLFFPRSSRPDLLAPIPHAIKTPTPTAEEIARDEKALIEEMAAKKKEEEAQRKELMKTPFGRCRVKHPDWSFEVCSAVSDHKILIGMTEEQVVEGWGRPDHVNTTTRSNGESRQWVMPWGAYLYFDNGVLRSIHQSH
jgi:hypothetical protein